MNTESQKLEPWAEEIINHPHHVSTIYPAMSLWERAAQFSSFAALGEL